MQSTTESATAEAVLPEPKLPRAWFPPQSVVEEGEADPRSDLLRRMQTGARVALLLDYDGTLAPFHADKMQAKPYPGVADLLQALHDSPSVRLVFVTGRRAAELPRLLPLAGHVEIWGSHGREHITADGEYTQSPVTAEQHALLELIAAAITGALGSVRLHPESTAAESPSEPLERKPGSLAVHWRGLDAASQTALHTAAVAAFEQHGGPVLQQLPFASGLEFRATGSTKAVAIRRALEQAAPGDVVAYLGDDLTDEDAFAALGQAGLSFLVGAHARPTLARFWLCPPADLLRFFTDCLQATSPAPGERV